MFPSYEDRKQFRSFILNLKRLNPTWSVGRMVRFIKNSDNPPPLNYKSLHNCISRIINRGTIDDKKRSGRPVTTTNLEFQQNVKHHLNMEKGASIRKTAVLLKQSQIQSSSSSVYRAAKNSNLNWYKKRKSQKLTDADKRKRIKCAKRLRRKFGIRKNSNKWKWNLIVNCDFSGLFPLQGFQNKRNDGVWIEKGEEVEGDLLNAQADKFPNGLIFWGAISSQGLIPSNASINVTEWLKQQRTSAKGKRKRIYLTGELYAKFLKEQAAPAIKAVFRKSKLHPIFQDDQDRKQRTQLVMETVDNIFADRAQPSDADAKFADLWRIENVWGALKENIRGKVFSTSLELENAVSKEWRKFSIQKCAQMMDEMPNRLRLIIEKNGEHVHTH